MTKDWERATRANLIPTAGKDRLALAPIVLPECAARSISLAHSVMLVLMALVAPFAHALNAQKERSEMPLA